MTDVESLEAELDAAKSLDIDTLADAIEAIGFECTRCGACCRGHDDAHTATLFPDEVRDLEDATKEEWRDIARPMPYGITERGGNETGDTFEWALQVDDCGDCTFYEETADGTGACTVHPNRPLVCQTYPFSVALGGTTQPMGGVVAEEGMVRAHECEGLGRDISREEAEAMATTLKERAIRELEEAIAVRDSYEPVNLDDDSVVVHDSEGPKHSDGTPIDQDS